VRAELDEPRDHLAGGVGLDGIVDVGAAQTGLEGAVLRLDPIHVDHQRWPVKIMGGEIGVETRRVIGAGGGSRPGNSYSHGHLQ
jgi:hypothetical protein